MRRSLLLLTSAIQTLTAESSQNTAPPDAGKLQSQPAAPRYDADLFLKDVDVYIFEAEWLYWDVLEGALDYAQKMNQPAWSTTALSYASGEVHTANFNLDPGLRVTIGYFNAKKFYSVVGEYTHLICRGKDRVEPPTGSGEYLTGTWPQITSLPLTHAHSNIFFDYNLFDLLINRVFITNPHLRLRLNGGGSVGWMHQDWKIQYFDGTGNNTTIRNQWRFIGGGLAIGLNSDWYWGKDIYMTGGMKIASYIGSYKNSSKQTSSFQPAGTTVDTGLPVRNSVYSDARPAFSMESYIGPSWQKNLGGGRYEVFVGYELNVWFNLQEIRRSSSGLPSVEKQTWLSTSAIALQGLTTRFTANF